MIDKHCLDTRTGSAVAFGLIVQLKPDDMRNIFDMFHHCADNPLAVEQIACVCDIHILSCTINVLTVIGQSQNVRVFF